MVTERKLFSGLELAQGELANPFAALIFQGPDHYRAMTESALAKDVEENIGYLAKSGGVFGKVVGGVPIRNSDRLHVIVTDGSKYIAICGSGTYEPGYVCDPGVWTTPKSRCGKCTRKVSVLEGFFRERSWHIFRYGMWPYGLGLLNVINGHYPSAPFKFEFAVRNLG